MKVIGKVIVVVLLLVGAGCAAFELSVVLFPLSMGTSLAAFPQPGAAFFLLVPLIIIAANLYTLIATEGYKRWDGNLATRVAVIAIVSFVAGILLVRWTYYPPEITAIDLLPLQ